MQSVPEHVRPEGRPRAAVAALVAVVLLLAGGGIGFLVLSARAERAAERKAERAAIAYAERQAGRSGAIIEVGQWWDGCAIYELGLHDVQITVAVVEADGAWTVARESGKPAYTFRTDNSYSRQDCLNIVEP